MPADPGANAGYLAAAYIVTAVILLGYAVALWRKSRTDGQTDGRTDSPS